MSFVDSAALKMMCAIFGVMSVLAIWYNAWAVAIIIGLFAVVVLV